MSDGLRYVVEDLEKFSSRDSDVGSKDSGMSKDAKMARRILNQCWLVSVERSVENVLSLTPMLDIGKGRAVGSGHRFLLQVPTTADHFFQTASAAFECCSVVST